MDRRVEGPDTAGAPAWSPDDMMVKRKTLGQVRAYYRISDKRVSDALRGMRDVHNTEMGQSL